MKFLCLVFVTVLAIVAAKRCSNKRTNSKLICYYSDVTDIDTCMCTHIILPANSDIETIETVQEKFKGGSVLLTVHEFNEDLVNVLKNSKVDGLEIDLKKLDDKNDVPDFISTVKSKLGSDLYFAVSIPPKAELLAKYYDLKALTKHADLFILQTAFLGASHNVTFHPSRLSGLWDMQNTDSVVDLISGMGAPLSKLVITSPVQAFQFLLQDETLTAPGSPALEIKSLTRNQLCSKMSKGSNWTLERDQDQSGPYIFSKNTWIAFDDVTSMDIKAKYSRVRGLAGLALKDLSQDGGEKCGSSLLEAAHNGLSKQTRAPRGAVLQSLEREILETPTRPLDTIQVSPYRISRVIDVEGNVHSIRTDTRTEFECARQGYFVHPRSCGRFYRCVKFDQLADDFNVFEFDCPAGLSFDSRYEVCVWPGSLPYSSACSGSSEIAPVPRSRFICPGAEGYYADPENCRWFFACLDHGKSPLSAYEFRCPFGLVFDESRLVCEWSWLVPKCGSGGAVGFEYNSHGAFGVAHLDAYNGLGDLGVLTLGGLSGAIVQPQAKIYTSVTGAEGLGAFQGAGLVHGNANVGYTGAAHLATSAISGHSSSVFHGKDSGIGLVGQNVLHGDGRIGTYSGAVDSGIGLVGQNGIHGDGRIGTYSGGVDTSFNAGHAFSNVNSGSFGNAAILQSTSGSNLGLIQNHGIVGGSVSNGAVNGASYQANVEFDKSNAHLQGGSGANLIGSNVFGIKTANVINHGVTLQQPAIVTSSGIHGQHDSSSYHHQSNLAQFSGAIHGDIGTQEAVVTAAPVEKIHIVGGISAVGKEDLTSGVQVSQNGFDINSISHVTPIPSVPISTISVVSPSPVVAVAAAPVPVVRTDSETYEGGVVANVPELQYKIVNPSSNSVFQQSDFKANADFSFSRGAFGLTNISQNLINYVSSTPSPVAVASINYGYTTPAASFVQVSTARPFIALEGKAVVNEGYHYEKPAIFFEEEPVGVSNPAAISSFSSIRHSSANNVLATNTYTASTPVVSLHSQQPAVVSGYSFANSLASNSEGYNYPKPTVAFEEKPVQLIQPVQPAVVSSFSINSVHQPAGIVQPVVSVTPTVPIIEQKVQPAVVSGYSFQHNVGNENYQYSSPAVAVKTVQPVVSVTPVTPLVHHNIQPAVVTSYNFQNHAKNEQYGFANSASSIKTVQPVVSVTPIVPVIQENLQPAVVSGYNFHNNFNKNEGYQYTRPAVSIKVAEPVVSVTPVVPVQPAVVSSFSFQNLARNEDYKQQSVASVTPATTLIKETLRQQPAVVSSFNFQNTFGSKNTVPFVTPATPVVQQNIQPVQPAIVSSYSFQNVANDENYKYTKQTIPVLPTVPVVEEQVFSAKQPNTGSYSFQTIVGNEGYKYNKQSVPLQPVQPVFPVVQHKLQPVQPVVSSYNFQNTANEGYTDTKQSVRPAVSFIPYVQPAQPTVVSSYSFGSAIDNENYKYTKQTVPLQPIVSVTPVVPTIHQKSQPAIVSSYSFNIADDHAFTKQTIPVQPIVSVTPTVPILEQQVHSVQPAVVSSYNFQNLNNRGSYKYNQHFQPVVPVVHQPVQPALVSSYNFQNHAKNDYQFTKHTLHAQPTVVSVTPTVPIIKEVVQPVAPAVVSSYSFQNHAKNEDYQFTKQTLHAQPTVVSVTPVVPVVHQPVRPAVVSSYNFQNHANNEDYQFTKQTLHAQPTVVSVTPTIPIIKEVVQPVAPAVVSSYSFGNIARNEDFNIQKSAQNTFNDGYFYSKPNIAFEEGPLPSITPVVSVTPVVPIVEKRIQPVAPAVVSSYSFQNSAFDKNENYNVVKSDYKSIQPVQPAVVSSFSIHNSAEAQGYSYTKPKVVFEERPLQPIKPVVVESYSFPQPIVKPTVAVTPIIEQKIKPVQPVIVTPQPSVIPVYSQETIVNDGRFGEKLSVSTFQQPITIQDTIISPPQVNFKQPTIFSSTSYKASNNFQKSDVSEEYHYTKPLSPSVTYEYENRQPVEEVPFVAKKAYITGQQQQSRVNVEGYNYPKPAIAFEERPAFIQTYSTPIVTSTVKYEQVSVPVNPFEQYIGSSRNSIKNNLSRGKTFVENYTYSTPRPDILISTPTPFKARGQVTFNENLYASTPRPTYSSTVAAVLASKSQPTGTFQFHDSRLFSTPKPIIQSTTAIPYIVSTQSTPLSKLSFGSVVTSTSLPAVISSTTPAYLDDSVVVTTPVRTYLPVKTVSEEYVVSPKQPVVVSKPKTYVRVNDFHPFLPAKLGAQCTCRSNTVTLRRKPVTVQPPSYSSNDDDGYVVKPNTIQQFSTVAPVQNGRIVLENYAYQPQLPVDATVAPVVVPLRKRVRVRPVTTPATIFSSELPVAPVTYAPEIFLRTTVTPTVAVIKETELRPSLGVAGRGYNLVKSTANEATTSNTFDRYGPGGWRSRQETLQGTIDCQRAGLFRHPEQCNKFYACRWDCTKKRFTLHVFNCPVHLTFDSNSGACNWPSQGPACAGNTLLPNE